MIIIGHKLIPFKPFYKVTNIEDIKRTPSNSTILFDFINEEVLEYCKRQDIAFALCVKDIKEACFANALGAKYILTESSLAKEIQDIATEYLFDAKILLHVEDENQIEIAAKKSIDGVVFKKGIK
ncbi:hypothetical protein [Sulfurospirillum arcachonense]|uniref:hypothetical protein n=1 Tax=Sulfurospirillum arcachonense TaxID=57666 RepID=UPI00046A0A26|nr:hypothetical protein [Sulfurospirillum arcachonense]